MNTKIKNFQFVEACLHWTHLALTEISYLNKARSTKEIAFVNGPPFHYYRISLHYMFIMEYIKLIEIDNLRFPQSHFASLEKLSNALYREKGLDFENVHDKNLKELAAIRSSDFYKKMKEDRDTKFAHIDAGCSTPLSFSSFTEIEIGQAYQHLAMFSIIMDRCTGVFDYSFAFQHADTRTDNFIKIQTNCNEYYFDNYRDALSKGYH